MTADKRRLCTWLALPVIAACLFAGGVYAQSFPAKTVRYLMPQPPGSGADTIGRIVAAGMAQAFAQNVIVDNRTGAAGNIGAEIAARAPADGYTIVQVSLTHAVNANLYRDLKYDLLRDFSPVIQLASSPSIVVVNPGLAAKNVAELVALAKARPGAINYASAGAGSATFLSTELFKIQAGINLLHVPYRGGGEAITSVIAGETAVYFSPVATALPQVRAGKLRALAVTTAQRLPLLADLPTLAEAGVAGAESGSWYGLLVPLKTPAPVIAIIRNAALSALKNPDTSRRLIDLGYVLIGDRPEEFFAHMKAEIAKLGNIIRLTGTSVN